MGHRRDAQDWQDWYDDDAFAAPPSAVDPAVAGLPESWWNYDWWVAGIVYAGLWLLESWTSGASASAGAGRAIQSLVTLLPALACCYGVFRVCRPYSRRLGQILCIAAGIAMLLAHSVSLGT